MAYTDPQTVTIASVANTLPRVSTSPNSSIYLSNMGDVRLTSSHQYGKRKRSLSRLDVSQDVQSLRFANAAQGTYPSMSASLVVDRPLEGITVAEAKAVLDGYIAYLAASSGAILTKFLGGEN